MICPYCNHQMVTAEEAKKSIGDEDVKKWKGWWYCINCGATHKEMKKHGIQRSRAKTQT